MKRTEKKKKRKRVMIDEGEEKIAREIMTTGEMYKRK